MNPINQNENTNSNYNSTEQLEIDENMLSIFKQTVKKWLDVDNEIRTLENKNIET